MPLFVYYEDDYADNGGMGLQEFDNVQEAQAFIEKRLGFDGCRKKTIDDYKVIEGRRLKVEPKVVVKSVRIR